MTQEELENTVMKMLLKCDNEVFDILNRQYDAAKVVSREFTGRGFVTHFSVPDELFVRNINGDVFDVQGLLEDNPKEVYIFILFVKDGKITVLEGVSFFDWDYDYEKLQLSYAFDDRRDYLHY